MTRLLALVFVLLLSPALAAAQPHTLTGEVVAVHDGDTLTILENRTQTKIRLAEIDAPELGQPYGKKAKNELSSLAFNKTASIIVEGLDRYGRTIGRITVEGMDVNAELVKRGAAWVYRKYSKDPSFLTLEQKAREARTGLWAIPEPIPPWEWRKSRSDTRSGQR